MNTKTRSLLIYFVILVLLCAGFVIGARLLGQSGVYLASGYMLTPAIAALITRLFFYEQHFKDANLHFGRLKDYLKYWLYSLGITLLSLALFTLFGAIRWDFSGKVFLQSLSQQFAMSGQSMESSLPPGLTPQMMLWIFFLGGLTAFNILPGLITGFGEEFGHRGFMYPGLLPARPWLGLLLGGLFWYAWHLPLLLVAPPSSNLPLWMTVVSQGSLMIGSICTHIYLCYVTSGSRSIFVPSIAHITLNNAARSFGYFMIVQNQISANLLQSLVMVLVVAWLYYRKELNTIPSYHLGVSTPG